ncbi:MAG: PolC-type DNA polymerase III [Bacilli bacterium]|nr:PolC-type DNA polymerase III [Bacilli bacterium]
MNSKIDVLINKLNLSDKCKKELKDSKLEKIVANKEKTNYCFYIEINNTLSIDSYDEFITKLRDTFYNIENVSAVFKVENINKDLIIDYFKSILKFYSKGSSMLNMFIDTKIELEDNKLVIYVDNVAELKKLEEYKLRIEEYLNKVGYSNIILEILVDEEESLKIQEEIENSKVDGSTVDISVLKEQPQVTDDNKPAWKKNYTPKRIETVDDPNVILGRVIDDENSRIDTIAGKMPLITVDAEIFGMEVRETRTDLRIFTLKITDRTDSIYAKIFVNGDEETKRLSKALKTGNWYRFRGSIKEDKFTNEDVLSIMDINISSHEEKKIIDDAPVKRVELHAHTMMSQMDGLTKLDLGKHTCELVSRCIDMGYRGVAITDHNGCQAFPIVYGMISSYNKKKEEQDKFKGLYGTELTLVDDTVNIVVRPQPLPLKETTYVVFDTETTGFNAAGGDQMIEIGAVKICDGNIIDRFDELIDPKRPIPAKITELTCITDDMVKGKDDEETVTKRFLEWAGDLPMVAHNAKFDISFIEMAMKKYNLGEFKNTVIDTLELSRTLDQGFARHGLSALVKRYNVPWEEDAHHRADYDAEGTALVFSKMLQKLVSQNFKVISDLDKLISKDEIHKFGRTFHFNAIALNKTGLKNLFKIISLANTVYLYKTPRILRSKLEELREGLLIGSGCYESEVFIQARSKEGQELTNIINFYDYVEVQPPECYNHLIQTSDFKDELELQNHIRKVVEATKEAGKIIVATGDVHHFTREDKIYREIIVNQKVPGGGRHPLAKSSITKIPSMHFRTTREMLEDFEFLGDDLSYEIVVENTNKVLDMVEELEVIIDTGGIPFSPRVKSDDGKEYLDCPKVTTEMVYEKASDWYGNPLPYNIEERIAKELYGDIVYKCCSETIKEETPNITEKELEKLVFPKMHEIILKGFDNVKEVLKEYLKKNWTEDDGELTDETLDKKLNKELGGIIGGGFDPIYLISQRLVKHSNDDGYLVGSRGSVGSSFVATMMGITEVNPLPAHYRCLKCKHSIFKDDSGNELGAEYSSGFDLPDKNCPECGEVMYKDGQDMPFATFLGFNADKVPDIDLNFSDLNQASAHEYTKVLFGVDNVYRAGTIGTVADKTAFGFVKGYCEDKNIVMRTAEIERLALGCTGVKRTTGQHPGGIVVVPDYMEVSDFTPFQFPADDPNSAWRTTHFDYHAIDQDLLKLDILGHSDPTQLRMIQDLTGTDILKVPLDDKDTMSIFTSTKALGVTNEQIMCTTGTLGIPEFGTPFTIGMVAETKPTTFAELIKISGLSHGTDVWLGNAQELIKNNIVPFKEVIGCRDDIMVYLMYKGVEPIKAFKIMEFVRKGRASKDPETWAGHKETMEKAGIEKWFIDSCGKIKYMFPKAHAAAYVISAFRIAWYKVHMPVYFYASWLTSKATDVDVETMIKGYDAIKNKIVEIQNKGYEATNKEMGQLESLKVCLEATARGIKFLPVDLDKSNATVWGVRDDTSIYPPFSSIDGLGDTVAKNIVEEREKRDFLSIEEVQYRAKVSGTLIDKMKSMGIFNGMSESNQLSLFD